MRYYSNPLPPSIFHQHLSFLSSLIQSINKENVSSSAQLNHDVPFSGLTEFPDSSSIFTAHKRSCGKVIFQKRLSVHEEGRIPVQRGSLSWRPPVTVEERAVRILLECILVDKVNAHFCNHYISIFLGTRYSSALFSNAAANPTNYTILTRK